jgi:hypothetical protein
MTIVFFLPVILRDAHRSIFALDKLEQQGNKIVILDATQYFNVFRPTATDPYIFDRIVRCKEKSDFIDFRNKLGESPVIFVTNNLYMQMACGVLNTLIRKQDRLLVASTRFTAAHYKYPKGVQKIFSQVVRHLDNYLPLYLFKFYYKNIRKIYVPDYFLGATKFITANNTILSVKKQNRIYVHSDDINYAFEPMDSVLDPSKKVGVFLDQMLPYFNGRNPDVHNNDVNRKYKKEYYHNLVRAFKKIQQDLELDELVIALHPEAVTIRTEIDEKFAPFKTYIGLTNELIKDSTIVFGHFSTALGMAAFYQKPIILLADGNMLKREDRKRFINSYSQELGLRKLRIDEERLPITKDLLHKNDELYNRYIKKFLKEIPYEGNAFYYAINKIKKDLMLRSPKSSRELETRRSGI